MRESQLYDRTERILELVHARHPEGEQFGIVFEKCAAQLVQVVRCPHAAGVVRGPAGVEVARVDRGHQELADAVENGLPRAGFDEFFDGSGVGHFGQFADDRRLFRREIVEEGSRGDVRQMTDLVDRDFVESSLTREFYRRKLNRATCGQAFAFAQAQFFFNDAHGPIIAFCANLHHLNGDVRPADSAFRVLAGHRALDEEIVDRVVHARV